MVPAHPRRGGARLPEHLRRVVDADDVGRFQTRFGEDSFVVVEKWASLDALMAHAASPHMREYAAKTKDLIAERAVHVLTAA